MAGVAAQAHTALHPWETRRWENGEARQDADESFFERGPTLYAENTDSHSSATGVATTTPSKTKVWPLVAKHQLTP